MKWFSPALWIVVLIFLAHQLAQKVFFYSVPFLDSYFDPFAAAVLGLYVLKMERKYLWKQKETAFKWYDLLIAVTLLALVSEELFPILSDEFTRDTLDYIAFGIGGIYFYFFLNDNPSKRL